MSSSVLRRALRPVCNLRHFSSLRSASPSSLTFPRFLTPQTLTLTLTKILPPISVRFASSKAVSPVQKIKRADENLLRVLEEEIECSEETDEQPHQKPALPKDMPFEIIDNPGDQSIILKREFEGEKIQVNVFMNFDEDDEEDEEEDEDGDEDENTSDALQPNISLVVTINKGTGPTIEFCCNLDSESLEIESMAIKRPDFPAAYEGPEFSDLDEGLQRALHKYLLARGIKGTLYEFLREYMMTKDDMEYLVWLKNMKKFVEK